MQRNSLKSLCESELASFQALQEGNNCGLYAISSAIKILTGRTVSPLFLVELTNKLWWQGRFYRVLPDWAITPGQLSRLTNFLSREQNLGLKARLWHLSPEILRNLLHDDDLVCLVTIYWTGSKVPAIYSGNKPLNVNVHNTIEAHTMLFAAYDPEHHNGRIATPWGFINSWASGSKELFWMSDADFRRSWKFWAPGIAQNACVLISRQGDMEETRLQAAG